MLDHSPKAHGYSLGHDKTKGILTKGSFLLKCLAAFCVMDSVGAAPAALPPFPSPSPTCGCSEEIAALQGSNLLLHQELAAELVAMNRRQEAFYQFMGMMPPCLLTACLRVAASCDDRRGWGGER